jgi:hypothetical protein
MNSKTVIDTWRKFLRESVHTDVVMSAFQNTDPGYLQTSVSQRNPGPSSAGSTFLNPVTVDDLVNAVWTPYDHPNIDSPAVGFRAEIPGVLGIADIGVLPADQQVRFQPAHGGKALVQSGPKEGLQLAEVVTQIPEGNRLVEHTTLILGPSRDDASVLTMWTFFPGDPTPKFPDITMDDIRAQFGVNQETVTASVGDAINMGYNFVKHVNVL